MRRRTSGERPLFPLSRRDFAAALLRAGAVLAALGGRAAAGDPEGLDRGLGGTGVVPPGPDETLGQDRGIGGTGVIGTVRRFGSIEVNDLRVTFPPDVSVSIDGRRATAGDLKVGHVVRVLARLRGDVLATRAIVARSEVVGPVDTVAPRTLVILGQRIELPPGVASPPHRPGDHLAVSGLRRPDGIVVASLVERRPRGPARLHGPLGETRDGLPTIGGLRIAGLAPGLRGRRLSLVGERQGDLFRPSSVTVELQIPFASAETLSIEAYVALTPDGLRLGSGLDVAAGSDVLAEMQAGETVRAVVVARPDVAGRLDAQSVHVENRSRGGARGEGPHGLGAPTEAPGRPGAPAAGRGAGANDGSGGSRGGGVGGKGGGGGGEGTGGGRGGSGR